MPEGKKYVANLFQPKESPPSAPRGLKATVGKSGSDIAVKLDWSEPGSRGGAEVESYVIYRGETKGQDKTELKSDVNEKSYEDKPVDEDKTYFYEVKAKNEFGEGRKSNEAVAKTLPPLPPENLKATVGEGPKVDLSWSAPKRDGRPEITGYAIYRNDDKSDAIGKVDKADKTTYEDTTVEKDKTYSYTVRAINVIKEGDPSKEAVVKTSKPLEPKYLKASVGEGPVVNLRWYTPKRDDRPEITNYVIYRGETEDDVTTKLKEDVDKKEKTYTDESVELGKTYFYKVSAVNVIEEGDPSNVADANTSKESPSAPRTLTATAGDSFVTLRWSPPERDGGKPITQYMIYRSTTKGGENLLEEIGIKLFYKDETVEKGTTYFYTVSAKNETGEGEQSNEEKVETKGVWDEALKEVGKELLKSGKEWAKKLSELPIMTPIGLATGAAGAAIGTAVKKGMTEEPPDPPQNLKATAGDGSVRLSWSAPSKDGGSPITNYVLYRNNVQQSTLGPSTTYTDSGLTNGTEYTYVVTAKNAAGESKPSSEAKATPAGLPSAPQNLTATTAAGEIKLDWKAPTGSAAITNYEIYRDGTNVGKTADGSTTTYTDSGLTKGMEYTYAVKAKNAAGESAPSNEVSATPQ
jgi:fibronectin type 3 domain-containing protein